jgi:hypothetical protein
MKPVDRIILGLVILAVAAAAFFAVRRRKRGGSCCGDCSACGGTCSCEKKNGSDREKG